MSGPRDWRAMRFEFGPGGPRRPNGPRRPFGGGGGGDDGDDDGGSGDLPLRPPFGKRERLIAAGVIGVLLIVLLVFFRPVLHGPLMWVWRTPLPWIVGLAILLLGRLLGGRAKLTVADLEAGRYPGRGIWASALALAALAFFALQAVNPLLVQRSIAMNTVYREVDGLPETGEVRLVPREVAERILVSGFNSSTERLTDLRVVDTADGLKWTAIRTPEGLVRRYSRKSEGLILQDAQNPRRSTEQVDAEFQYAPGLRLFDALTWQLRQRRLLVDLADPVGILGDDGRPLILVPYVRYVGFPIRRPTLGGAFLVHPDGRIEDLSPDQARRRPEIARSGRLVPDGLVRREHDAYALRGGIWNYLFLHQDQTEIVDTELNRQPYLLKGSGDSNMWVSTAEPYGRSRATTAIFMTDSTTGETQIWNVPEGRTLTGNARALAATRSLTIPGVTFATTDVRNTGSGFFRAIEPRPVFVDGDLYFIVSVIPDSAENVAKTVVIDASSNQSVGIYDTDEEGLAELQEFLRGDGRPNQAEGQGQQQEPTAGENPTPGTTPAPGGSSGGNAGDVEQRLDNAIQQQEQVLQELRSLREQLGQGG